MELWCGVSFEPQEGTKAAKKRLKAKRSGSWASFLFCFVCFCFLHFFIFSFFRFRQNLPSTQAMAEGTKFFIHLQKFFDLFLF